MTLNGCRNPRKNSHIFFLMYSMIRHFCKPYHKLHYCVLLLAVAGCQPGSSSDQEEAVAKPPNIILIYTDELQFSDISAYGGEIPTPAIDQLAADGIRFDQAHTTASMCTPSRFSLLTGLYPGRCRHPAFQQAYPDSVPYSVAWNTYLTPETGTIPKYINDRYFTGMSGKWHLSSFPESIGVPRFREEEDPANPAVARKLIRYQQLAEQQIMLDGGFEFVGNALWGNFDGHPLAALRFHNIPWFTQGAIEFLDSAARQDQPFFLYLTPTAIHGPNHADDLFRDVSLTLEGVDSTVLDYEMSIDSVLEKVSHYPKHLAHRYSGMAQLDHQLYVIRKKLKALELTDNTIIIFMADHNIEPGKSTCYEKGTRVPMILFWPGSSKPGTTTDALVGNTDILPTILEAAGKDSLKLSHDGYSLLPLVRGNQQKIRDHLISEAGYARGITNGSLKYIAVRHPIGMQVEMANGEMEYAPNWFGSVRQAHASIAMEHFPFYFAPDQLYDLETDPYEQQNLMDQADSIPDYNILKTELIRYTSSLPNAYPWSFLKGYNSSNYEELTTNTQGIGTDYIEWLKRDHDKIVYPPVNN